MNERFYSLPARKQEAIINAGFRVFSQNSYKKSPMSEIADAAGISKSLLFHYFENKKELYLFLWKKCADITMETLQKSGCYDQQDLFDAMYLGLKAKAAIMRQYPNLGAFVLKAYYEKDPAVHTEIQESIAERAAFKTNAKLLNFDPDQFLPGLDLGMMYQDMYRVSEGYLWEKLQQGELDVDEMEQDFTKMMDFWKSVYLRKEV
ncbi:MAG: TetR/AcrR family transcriptional regulator [Fusicatenibacter sp.]|nr:TetR/AcrR family transcriptional regulator [Fusicatenibacter sp.]